MKPQWFSRIFLGALLAAGWCWSGSASSAEDLPVPLQETVRVVYRLYYSAIPVGEVTEVWIRVGNSYRVSSEAQPYAMLRWFTPSIRETSSGSVVANTLVPSHFEHYRSDGGQALIAEFHWDTGELEHNFDGKSESVKLVPGTQDMLSLKYLYRVAGEAMLGRDIPMSTGKTLETHHLVLQDEEVLDTAAGQFKTRHVVDEGQLAPSRFELWLPEDRRYPPVRMQVTERGNQWEQRMLRVEVE